MANVFLSYSRRDFRRAKPLIKALEAAGLSVWWDRRLTGGSEFSREIREQLEAADVVVALWSKRSVTSPWVLDEASHGRNHGRLVPATIDGIEPPLGFGQIHTIDLTRRSRDYKPLDALVAAVLARAGVERSSPPPDRAPRISFRHIAIAGLIAAVIFVAATAFYIAPWRASDESPAINGGTVAVYRFEALTNDRESKLTARLAGESAERIFSTNFIKTVADWTASRDAVSQADFAMRGTVDRNGDSLHITADVIDIGSGRTLWSTEVARPASEGKALGDQLAIRVADVLRCAIYNKERMPRYHSTELFSRILQYCDAGHRGTGAGWQKLPKLTQSIVDIAPDSAQAHAIYANALSLFEDGSGDDPDFSDIYAEVKKTLALDPDNGAIRWTMGHVADPSIGLAERERHFRDGLRLDPDYIYNRNALANLMLKVGRIEEGGAQFEKFVFDYPLNYVQRAQYGYQLAETDIQSAREQFALIEQYQHESTSWTSAIILAEMLWGDAAHAEHWLQIAQWNPTDNRCVMFTIKARQSGATPSAAAIEGQCGPGGYGVRAQALFGHVDEALRGLNNALRYVLPGQFGPHWVYERGFEALRQDPRLIGELAKIGVPQYWLETGRFADFCTSETLPYDCRKVAVAAVAALKR